MGLSAVEMLQTGQARLEDGKSMAGDVVKPQREDAPVQERVTENDFLLGNSELVSSPSARLRLTHPFDSDEYHFLQQVLC